VKSGTIYCRSSTVVAVHELKPLYIGNCVVEKTVFFAKCKDKAKGIEHVLALNYHTVNAYEGLE